MPSAKSREYILGLKRAAEERSNRWYKITRDIAKPKVSASRQL